MKLDLPARLLPLSLGFAVLLVTPHLLPATAYGADPFAENVRTTPALSPAEEQKSFHLPPGFEIQLVASEPEIMKPMNMAFDAKGRLWVTVTREYPYPVPLDRTGRDAILVLEDNDNDGRADKITTFAEGLNIPTGLYPYGNGVIAWSIPNIWYFQDTDGDGKADRRDVLFGPLGWERDTHGMDSSFRRGYDGWLYITHGYNNNTTVRGRDGSAITMNSGNTYRVRLDGSRVEQHTWGQVNPFGLCFDALGNLYSADCHSAPIYQLLDGGYYPSFGKPHDGLGFAPTMIEHSHDSTAIAGLVYYVDNLFPAEFQDNIFIGNVMTSRVNRDALTETGSTKIAGLKPDFVSTDDPWFRPVDIQLGPDGAFYIADFYNRIIGHYEVPLAHPGRDRTSGRIWRVVYRGQDGQRNARPRRDLTAASSDDLISALADPNLTYRMLALNQLTDRVGPAATDGLKKVLAVSTTPPSQLVHALWALQRLGATTPEVLVRLAHHADRGVRTHVMRILADTKSIPANLQVVAREGLGDRDAFVQRCAAEALGKHPDFANIVPLLEAQRSIAAADTHTIYGLRKALRDQLLNAEVLTRVRETTWDPSQTKALADVALAVNSADAGLFLLQFVSHTELPQTAIVTNLAHIARYLPETGVPSLVELIRRRFGGDAEFQSAMFDSIETGLQQRGAALGPEMKAWGAALARQLLELSQDNAHTWVNYPLEGSTDLANPWVVQKRDSADGAKAELFLSTLPSGEKSTGVLHSPVFVIPAQLSFFMAGHDGFPDKRAQKKNFVALYAAKTRTLLQQAFAPRNDLAQRIQWDTQAHAGESAYLEISDADTGTAYAWLAVGRFEPPVITVPATSPNGLSRNRVAAADLVGKLQLRELDSSMIQMLGDSSAEIDTRAAAAHALLRLDAEKYLPRVRPAMVDGEAALALREQIGAALAEQNIAPTRELLVEALRAAPFRLQSRLALGLAGSVEGAGALLNVIAAGQVPARLLVERPIRDKIVATKNPAMTRQIETLTKGLTPPDEKIQRLLETRRQAFAAAKTSPEAGQRVFTQNCAACHQIDGQGGLIGPQLDGIGNRGAERLSEDILDPNRNVDRAFRSTLFVLKDGDVVSGLFRREEGELIILAESTGKEISVPKLKVAERRESETSLMPENFGELLAPEDFNQLLGYLLSHRPAAAGK